MPATTRQPYTLWSSPAGSECNSLAENGITEEIIARLSAANTAVEPPDISERLKPFDKKLEETANGRVVY